MIYNIIQISEVQHSFAFLKSNFLLVLFIHFYFWLHWAFLAVFSRSLVVAGGGLLCIVVFGFLIGFLIVVASLVAEHRL